MSNLPNTEFIQFQCSECRHQLKVPSQAAGKRAQCPRCSHVQAVPSQDASHSSPPSNPAASNPAASDPAPQSFGALNINTSNTGPLNTGSGNANPLATNPINTQGGPAYPVQQGGNPAMATGNQPFDPRTGMASPMSAPTSAPMGSPMASTAPSPISQPTVAPRSPELKRSIDRKHEGEQTDTRKLYDRICEEVAKVYIGQEELILGSLVALFSSGHVLIESVPGLGKTLFVRTLGKVLGCDFGRIQFTADLMPSDVTGAPIFSMKTQEFEFRPGPVFTQLLLADEINRAPAKTHAALLEIMQEYRVTVDGKTHQLHKPFLVLATQNPIESEGTYNLPEAQLDRFMFKLFVDYPDEAEEARILDLHSRQVNLEEQLEKEVETVASPDEINRITHANAEIRIVPALVNYINKIVRMTRQWPQFHMGASPRAGLALMQGARTLAAFSGRDYAIPDDVIEIVLPTLRHRVILTAEAEVEGHKVDDLLREMIRTIEVPRI